MWRSEILLQDLESYRGRPPRKLRKQQTQTLPRKNVSMKLEWPLESQRAFTRSKLRQNQLQEHICGTMSVSQYENTCWIASVAFVVLNVKEIWEMMDRKVQDYVLKFFKNPYEATMSTSHYLRHENLSACRRIPQKIAEEYKQYMFIKGNQYIDNSEGGAPDALLHAFAHQSRFKIVNLPVDTPRIGNRFHGNFLHQDDVNALKRGLLSIDCTWDANTGVPGPLFFSKKLHAMCLVAKGTPNINLLGGFVDINFFHVMGFVRCRDFSNLQWSYQDDFYVNQSYMFNRGGRTSTLDTISEEKFDYNNERTRGSPKKRITNISFIYKINNFNTADLETIMEPLKEIFFQTYKNNEDKEEEEDDEEEEDEEDEEDLAHSQMPTSTRKY